MGKYFKYAIGEILLVVVGILIALQINNWNEQKANEERFLSVLQEIKTDITNDTRRGNNLLKEGKEKDSLFLKVLNQEFTEKDYKEDEDYNLFWLGLNQSPFEYQTRGFTKFENFNGVIPKKFEILAELIAQHYTVYCKTFEAGRINTKQTILDRHEYLSINYYWYHQLQFEEKSDEIISFYLEDPIYKNWIFQSYQFSTTGNNTDLQTLLDSAFRLLIMISDINGEEVRNASFYEEFLGEALTPEDMEVAGRYYAPESGREFNLEIKAGYLMFEGLSLLKKIGKDKYQSASFKEWYYEIVRDESGKVIEFIMNDTGNKIIYKCEKRDD